MFILNTDLLSFFRSLRPRYKTGILSNAFFEVRARITEAFHIEHDLDLIMISSKERYHKPQPEIFRIALDRLGVQPEEKRRTSLMIKRGICISTGFGNARSAVQEYFASIRRDQAIVRGWVNILPG